MRRRAPVFAALASLSCALALPGCATGAVVADRVVAPALDRALQQRAAVAEQPVLTLPQPLADEQVARATATRNTEPSQAVRWLYGSAEAAAASIQSYRMVLDYAKAVAASPPAQSVAMGLPGSEDGVGKASCRTAEGGRKPLAIIFDADETVILNSGHEYWRSSSGQPFDSAVWAEWERSGATHLAPVPGAVTALRGLREAGITPIFNTNRALETGRDTVRALAATGLGDTVIGETLFLRDMDRTGSRKDERRARIASRYCVIAMVGDNLGDFADVFNHEELGVQERRRLAGRGEYARLWGNGWFVLPNPVYGAFDRGTLDEVFPPDARWTPGIQVRAAPDIMTQGN